MKNLTISKKKVVCICQRDHGIFWSSLIEYTTAKYRKKSHRTERIPESSPLSELTSVWLRISAMSDILDDYKNYND